MNKNMKTFNGAYYWLFGEGRGSNVRSLTGWTGNWKLADSDCVNTCVGVRGSHCWRYSLIGDKRKKSQVVWNWLTSVSQVDCHSCAQRRHGNEILPSVPSDVYLPEMCSARVSNLHTLIMRTSCLRAAIVMVCSIWVGIWSFIMDIQCICII